MSEDTIRKYKNGIRQQLIDKLLASLDGFTVYNYIMGEKVYPYLDPKYADPSQLLLLMDTNSEVFLQNERKDVTGNTSITQHLFIHTDMQSERMKWEQIYPKYFRTKPSCDSTVSIFNLVVVQENRLNMKDIKMLNLA